MTSLPISIRLWRKPDHFAILGDGDSVPLGALNQDAAVAGSPSGADF
jgi:hypothetical protein